jgi:hypothetical protein
LIMPKWTSWGLSRACCGSKQRILSLAVQDVTGFVHLKSVSSIRKWCCFIVEKGVSWWTEAYSTKWSERRWPDQSWSLSCRKSCAAFRARWWWFIKLSRSISVGTAMKDEASHEQVLKSVSINSTREIEFDSWSRIILSLVHTPDLKLLWLNRPTIVLVQVDTSFSPKVCLHHGNKWTHDKHFHALVSLHDCSFQLSAYWLFFFYSSLVFFFLTINNGAKKPYSFRSCSTPLKTESVAFLLFFIPCLFDTDKILNCHRQSSWAPASYVEPIPILKCKYKFFIYVWRDPFISPNQDH